MDPVDVGVMDCVPLLVAVPVPLAVPEDDPVFDELDVAVGVSLPLPVLELEDEPVALPLDV
jgi:hypothetical protein